jgi:hypothetical protein
MEVTLRKDGRYEATIGGSQCISPVCPKSKEGFINGHVTKKRDQKWVRDFPTEGEIEQLNEVDRGEMQERELKRREEGCWFYNNGEPTYLTGDNYFYLTHFKLPAGYYPQFRVADLKFFWWWKFAVEDDPNCIGGVFMGARQRGKTARAASLLLNYATLNCNVWCGITSKTESDAKDVFQLFIVPGWQNMSEAIRPKLPSGDSPKTEMVFSAEARKGKKATNSPRQFALNSKIDYRNSKENAYDSKTLARKFTDEPFKKQDADSSERLNVESRMMWPQGFAVGKMLLASTVDEQSDFDPATAETIWAEANPAELTEVGTTKNGLKRLFMPSFEAYRVDEYGHSLIEESRQHIEQRAPTDPVKRRGYFRANPRHEQDAFSSGGKDSIFNLENLDAAKLRVANLPEPEWRQVDLAWVDPDNKVEVKTVDNKVNGRFRIIMRALPEQLNQVDAVGTHLSPLGEMVRYKPRNNATFAIGTDPYDARSVADPKSASQAAAYCYRKLDSLHEADQMHVNAFGREVERPDYWPTGSFIVEYVNRPPRPADFYEDMIKLCHLFGCGILPENQKPGIIAHFEDRGYSDFIQGKISIIGSKDKSKKPKHDTPGMAASTDATGQWSERIAEFTHGLLGEDLRRMPFAHQIKDVATLNILDTKKNDAGVATGWTLLLAMRFSRPKAKPIESSVTNLSNYFNIL